MLLFLYRLRAVPKATLRCWLHRAVPGSDLAGSATNASQESSYLKKGVSDRLSQVLGVMRAVRASVESRERLTVRGEEGSNWYAIYGTPECPAI